jgi:ParB/RepB/Spo0J family partition protein
MSVGASGAGATFGRRRKSIWDLEGGNGQTVNLPLEDLLPNPFNPRTTFNEDHLRTLANSIQAEDGLLQDLRVAEAQPFIDFWLNRLAEQPDQLDQLHRLEKLRDDTGDLTGKYVVLVGHRRIRALQLANRTTAPCQIDAQRIPRARIIGLSENLNRVDLNPIEEAQGYKSLIDDGLGDQNAIAKEVGCSQGHVSRLLALLKLPVPLQDALASGELTRAEAETLRIKLRNADSEKQEADMLAALHMMQTAGVKAAVATARILYPAASDLPAAVPPQAGDGRMPTAYGTQAGAAAQASGAADMPLAYGTQADTEAPAPGADGRMPTAYGTLTGAAAPASGAADMPTAYGTQADTEAPAPASSHIPTAYSAQEPQDNPPTDETPPAAHEAASKADAGERELPPYRIAAAARDEACQYVVAASDIGNPRETLRLLVPVMLEAEYHRPALILAHRWLRAVGLGPDNAESVGYHAAVLESEDTALALRVALAVALAAAHLRASDPRRTWDARDRAHLQYLRDTGYKPTDWELSRLDSLG